LRLEGALLGTAFVVREIALASGGELAGLGIAARIPGAVLGSSAVAVLSLLDDTVTTLAARKCPKASVAAQAACALRASAKETADIANSAG